MSQVTYLTVCTNSYIGYAITLGQSLRSMVPGARLLIYITDKFQQAILPTFDEIEFVAAENIGIAGFEDMAKRYNAFEFSTAMKAPCILHAIKKRGAKSVIYLDSDILVLQPLDAVTAALDDGYDCILTPHITKPAGKGAFPPDNTYLLAGVFNLGFAAFSNREPAISFLRWWAQKKREDCTFNLAQGITCDQTYCNLAPAFIEKLLVLRDPGYNLAYWNLDQRPVTFARNGIAMTGNKRIRFVHFSGVDFRNPDTISRHNPKLTRQNTGNFAKIFDAYISAIGKNDAIHDGGFSAIEYGFAQKITPPPQIQEAPLAILRRPPRLERLAKRFRRYLAK